MLHVARLLVVTVSTLAFVVVDAQFVHCRADETKTVAFRRHDIDPQNPNSSAAIMDVNGDGKLDIAAGQFWYQGPTWKKHFLRDVEVILGRNDDYSCLPLDVNGDGRQDLVSVNYRSKSLYWVEHPGQSLKGPWQKHVIDTPGPSETGRLEDIDGDGRLDVLPNGTDFAAWYEVVREKADGESKPRWVRHELPKQLAGHGIGFGDVNGDGRGDIVGPAGWAAAPEDRRQGRWQWHAGPLLDRDAGIPILVFDVDGDGDNDIVWGRGHSIGLYWLEQLTATKTATKTASGGRQPPESARPKQTDSPPAITTLQTDSRGTRWQRHAIDTSWSQPHSILLADIDGDGQMELVSGKRYMGHDGKDPGEYDPLVIAWYKYDRGQRTWSSHVVLESMDVAFGLDPKCQDIDGDGDADILCADRSGLYLLENLQQGGDSSAEPAANQLHAAQYEDRSKLLQFKSSAGKTHPVTSPAQWAVRRAHILQNMQRVMGPLPSSDRRVPLNMTVKKTEDTEHYHRHWITYDAEPGDSVPALLLVPKKLSGRSPALLCLHPTSPLGKAQVAGLGGKASRFYAHELAERGYVCLVPDYPSFGEYKDYHFAKDEYVSGSMKAIWNNIRGVDLLLSLAQVDGDRIGAIGHSLGGHNALFTAAFDQRIRAVVTSCGFTAFDDYYGGDLKGWTSDRYMPRIRDDYGSDPAQMPFDFHEVLGAIAPRGVFISAPLHDGNFDVGGVKKCVASAGEIYKLRGRDGNLKTVYPDCQHDFPEEIRQQAYHWLGEQLKK